MGGAQTSEAIVNSINERVVNIASEAVTHCQVASAQEQDQVQVIGGIFSSGATMTAEQNTTISQKCFQDTKIEQKLQAEVANAVVSEAAAKGVSLFPSGEVTARSMANFVNKINTTVNMRNIQKNFTNIMQKQKQQQTNIALFQFGTNMKAVQGVEVFSEAVVQSLNQSGILDVVRNQAELQAESIVESPLSFIGYAISSLFGGLASMWTGILGSPGTFMFFLVLIILVIALARSGTLKELGKSLGLVAGPGGKAKVATGVATNATDAATGAIPSAENQKSVAESVASVVKQNVDSAEPSITPNVGQSVAPVEELSAPQNKSQSTNILKEQGSKIAEGLFAQFNRPASGNVAQPPTNQKKQKK